jgi:hypothetical protein
MTSKLTNLENFIVLVINKRNKKFKHLARIVGFRERNGCEEYRLEFSDRTRAYARPKSLELYYRYCGCNGRNNGDEWIRCEHFDRGIPAARDRFCELNEQKNTERFCREYGLLFFS